MASAVRVAAVFKDTNVVKEIFPSMSAAKKEVKGVEGIVLVKENAPEATVIQFPPVPEKPVKKVSTAGSPTNVTIRGDLSGAYAWTGAPRSRLKPDDPRAVYHDALAENTSFEAYFEAVKDTPEVTVTTLRGGTKTDTAKIYAKYAVRCGWVKVEGFDNQALKHAAERGEYQGRAKTEKADEPIEQSDETIED